MKLHCEHCGKTFTAPDSWKNTKVRCPACNQIIDTHEPEETQESQKPPKTPTPVKKPAGRPAPSPSPSRPTADAPAKPSAKSPEKPSKKPSEKSPPVPPRRKPEERSTAPPSRPTPSHRSADKDADEDDEFALSPEESRPTPQVFLESTPDLDQGDVPSGRTRPGRPTSSQSPPKTPPRPSPKSPRKSPPKRSPSAGAIPAVELAGRKTRHGDGGESGEDGRAGRGERAKKKACPNCRAAMPSGATVCGTCGFHLILKRVISMDVNEDTLHETQGLDRWLRSMMEEGESLDSVFLLFHVLLAFIGIVLAVVYHPWGWLVLGVTAAIYLAVIYMGKITGSYHRWSLWGWDKLLGIYRRLGWRTLLPPFTPRVTLVRHDIEFTDDVLEEMEDIFDYEVLDLEGSNITDRSLLHLAGCERLQFIVVRRTQVTRKGILRLQSMLPQVLIWS